ncbi:MAG TPA: alpha/beta hydrolase [Gemmatimonadales bacterium]|nr:alpha/beta hydrolase [Gemmatimonadales bacterium]
MARVLAAADAITAPGGVDTLARVELGGIPQWISVRGRDRRNPVLLFLHGGPGFPTMPVSHRWQGPWEEYFTVVQWDQRGAGKTYAASDPAAVRPTLTIPRMIADAEELVRHLRTRYGQERIVLVGHSWGTVLGVELARRHPEWFSVYVGIGQGVDVPAQERMGYEALLDSAARARDTVALAELRALAPYPERDGTMPVAKLYVERKWMRAYGGYNYQHPEGDHYADFVAMSPAYTDAEIATLGPAIEFGFRALWPQLQAYNFWDVTELRVPVVLFHGTHDLTTPLVLAERWLDRLHAPSKALVRFEQSAHMVMMEEPGKLFFHLVRDVRPLASRP